MSVVQQPSNRASHASPLSQHIDALLSQKGLTYQENAKPTIGSHLLSLLKAFPGLQLKPEPFTHGDGRHSPLLLLQVGGTIPIVFRQVSYNIPVVIWLPEQYPFCAPLVFVTPSPFMIIKAAHPLVDHRSGSVSCAHLYSWIYPSSNLVDLVCRLCIAFGQDPPLYSVNHPPRGPDGSVSAAVALSPSRSPSPSPSPSPSSAAISTSGTSMHTSSLLGPGSSVQTHLHGARVPMAHSETTHMLSASLLGPGSLPQHRLSHDHTTPQSSSSEIWAVLNPHHHTVSLTSPLPSASSSSSAAARSSHTPLPVWPHPVNGGASMEHVAASTSTTASLLGPGKLAQWHLLPPAERHMVLSQAPPDSTGLWKHPSLSLQGQLPPAASSAHSGSLPLLTSIPQSILGPGNLYKPPVPLHVAENPLLHSSLPSSTSLGPCSGHSSMLSTASSSGSLLGTGPSSQWQPSMAQASTPSLSSSLPVRRMQAQQQTVNLTNGGDKNLNMSWSCTSLVSSNLPASTTELNSSSLLPMPQYMGSFSTSSRHSAHSPLGFSNPLLNTKDQPQDRRQALMNVLIGRLQCDIGEIGMTREKDMHKLMDMEGLLKHRQVLLKKMVEELQQQKENLEVQLQNLLINTDLLETWLLANDKRNVEINIDNAFEPCDGLSCQLLECAALDLAIEDAFYCLDQAVQQSIVPVDSYLRLVRMLSREQFFHRAVAIKVRATQNQG